MEPTTAIGTAKNALSLNLKTPYLLAASTLGSLSLSCVFPGRGAFNTPFEALSKFFIWAGWMSPVTWLNAAHDWICDSTRIDATHAIFVFIALFGTVCASYSRASFAALVGIAGLVETGSPTEAWLIPVVTLVAMLAAGRLIRGWSDELWEHAVRSFIWMVAAVMYSILALGALIFGEQRDRKLPQPVELNLSRETQRYIDKIVKALGISTDPPPPFR